MRKEDIPRSLTERAFDFFYWFSRFEYALKDAGYLKSKKSGALAEPGWGQFVDRWAPHYVLSDEAISLLDANPQMEVIGTDGCAAWRPTNLQNCSSELAKVVQVLKVVRNNLFHGGKHGGGGWDDAERTEHLLMFGLSILAQLAKMAAFEASYTRYY